MSNNSNLHLAKRVKNDEFYTLLEDIEKELSHYTSHFRGKTVLCNCNDSFEWSNFWKYLYNNFHKLGLKKLLAVSYGVDFGLGLVAEYKGDGNFSTEIITGGGDFRSEECVKLLKMADIVVTNPPFSLFRDFIELLIKHDKKFLVIGNLNAVKYKNIFPLIKEGKLWLGVNNVSRFVTPKEGVKKFGNVCWFTNLDTNKRHSPIKLSCKYDSSCYTQYDSFPAINVNRVNEIPVNWGGLMGVPITILQHHCPEQFEIVGELNHGSDNEYDFAKPILNGKEKFPCIVIKHRKGA